MASKKDIKYGQVWTYKEDGLPVCGCSCKILKTVGMDYDREPKPSKAEMELSA